MNPEFENNYDELMKTRYIDALVQLSKVRGSDPKYTTEFLDDYIATRLNYYANIEKIMNNMIISYKDIEKAVKSDETLSHTMGGIRDLHRDFFNGLLKVSQNEEVAFKEYLQKASEDKDMYVPQNLKKLHKLTKRLSTNLEKIVIKIEKST